MMETQQTLNNGMCRCCASEGTFKDIKTKYHWMGDEEIYADMLTDCFDIKILTNDVCDNGICEVCITQLRNAANFKKQVLHTEEQFKKRLHGKDFKNPIKLETVEDIIDSDHQSDPDFSGAEYEVPIKEEDEEKPKAKKRTAKATAARAKKAKPTADAKRIASRTMIIKIDSKRETRTPEPPRIRKVNQKQSWTQTKKNQQNLAHILLNSNANPIRRHDGDGFMCAFCPEQFVQASVLKKHFLEEHNDDRLIKLMAGRILHRSVKLDISYLNCALCDTDIPTLDEFVDHLMSAHNKEMYTDLKNQILPFKFDTPEMQCAKCSAEFASFKMLQEHMNSHFRNYICDTCGASFVTERPLLNHIKRHGDGEFDCERCQKTFVNELKLKEHEKRVHMGPDKRNKCHICYERFTDYRKKIRHLVTEHGVPEAILKCQACDRSFNNQKALAYHTKKHHLLERKHKCTECDMRFYDRGSLEKHMPKHTGIKNFKCAECFKSFGRKNTLREHMRIHTDDRRFPCPHCGQAFIQKCSLKGHLRSKHSDII